MKLYPLLFEQEQLKLFSPEEMKAPESAFKHLAPSKIKTDYTSNDYGLFSWNNGGVEGFALFHINKFKEWIKSGEQLSWETWICAYAGTEEKHNNNCSGAVEINYMARNPKFPGSGATMYALISSYYRSPITSDRVHSTSDSAKKAWARIESSGEWEKVELDNYSDIEDDWYRFKGTWPNRSVTTSDEPSTPDKYDDCKTPRGIGSDAVNNKLGTANAWIYHGSLNAHEISEHAEDALPEIAKETGYDRRHLESRIKSTANKLFSKYYQGIEG